ncbi:MAG: hypothetical protein ACRDUS_21915 [Mycobacterium sp.]
MKVRAILAATLGLLMVAAAVEGLPKYALPLSVCAAVLVLVGLRIRAAATFAVLSIIGVLALGNDSAVLAMVSGLAAVTYLLTTYPLHWTSAVVAVRYEVVIPAMLFASAALLATAVPVQRPSWLPLIVPVAVVLIYVVAVWPVSSASRTVAPRNSSIESIGST